MAYILAQNIKKEYDKNIELGRAKYIHYFVENNKLEQYREDTERYFFVWEIEDVIPAEGPIEGGEE